MKISKQRRRVVQLVAVCLLLAQASCANLTALRKFTDESVKAGAKFKELAADSYRTCAIGLYYQGIKSHRYKRIELFDSPSSYLASIGEEELTLLDGAKECEKQKSNWKNFEAANKVLITYLYVMGQLAADDIATTDDEFTAVRGAISGIPNGDNPILAAALGLSNTIANMLLDGKRRSAIKAAVLKSNEDIGKLSDELTKALEIYIEKLKNEKNALKGVYEFALAEYQSSLPNNGNSNDPFLVLSKQDSVEADFQKVNSKIKAAQAYQKVLSGIKKGHQELYEEAQKGFDLKNAVRIALKYTPSIQSNYNDLAKAFQ